MPACYIDRNKIKKLDMVNIKGGIKYNDLYNKYKPNFIINLALYDSLKTGINITNMEDENVQSGYLFTEEGIGIKGENEIIWTTKDISYDSEQIRDFVGGSPILVKDALICIDWGNKYSSYVDQKHIRSAIGFNDDYVILYVSDKVLTIRELAHEMIKLGSRYAINCDGGGSSHLQEGGTIYKKSIRNNASWFLVYTKEEEFKVTRYGNISSSSQPVYETTECKKKIGSLDPYEECDCLYELSNYRVVMYNITGTNIKKVGFIKR